MVDRPTLAAVLGVSLRFVGQLEAEGAIAPAVRGRGGRPSLYDLALTVPAYLQRLSADTKPSRPHDRYWRARADREELDVAARRAELLPRDQVVSEGRAFTAALAGQVRHLGPRLEQAGYTKAKDRAAVHGLLREVLAEIAAWQTFEQLAAAAALPGPDAPPPAPPTTKRKGPRR